MNLFDVVVIATLAVAFGVAWLVLSQPRGKS